MELQGKIIAVLPERGGVSQRSGTEWKVQEYVIETHETYPKKMVFDVFGADRISRFNIQIGQEVLVAFDIDAHEWNGRWFNSIRAFDVRPVDPSQMGSAPAPSAQPYNAPTQAATDAPAQAVSAPVASAAAPTDTAAQGDSAEDLPF